ncbi:UDP-glycosyltransferase UGT5-like [Lycorma delicatula]|uniref:UDP-glycosyltransferase UGT5-like n=1 Tax=Lycorma delicatula TaxID=130591 RepID=UPI003F50F416
MRIIYDNILVYFLIFILKININNVNSSKILGIFPFGAKSHYIMFEPLMIELANRGHEVVVISAFPQEKSVPRLTDISAKSYLQSLVNNLDINEIADTPFNMFIDLYYLYKSISNASKIFDVPDVKKLIDSKNEKFDLIITEFFNNDITLSFVNRFKVPSIALSSCTLFPWANSRFGNPDNPSYVSVIFNGYQNRMNFWQRTYNTVTLIFSKLAFNYFYTRESDYFGKKYFGNDLPPLAEIGKNTSLILVNTHYSLHGSRPFVPAVIEVGGIHVKPPKKLSQVFN